MADDSCIRNLWICSCKDKIWPQRICNWRKPGSSQTGRSESTAVVTKCFVIIGVLTALGGIVFSSRMNSGQPAANINLEFDAITAVILGGVSFAGGVGDMFGTVLGVILIQAFNTGLIMVNVSTFWQYVARWCTASLRTDI